MTNRFMMTTLAFAAVLGCAEAEKNDTCSEADCIDGIDISLVRDDWAPGSYVVELDMDGTDVECTATVPSDVSESCSDDDVELITGPNGEIIAVEIMSAQAETVTIQVLQDGVSIGSADIQPEYQQIAPNGEECGPICSFAMAEVVLD
jgi:hypothetical protein